MTRRAYISCPLEAALAAKNFGFEFKCLANIRGNDWKIIEDILEIELDCYREVITHYQLSKYYIKEESLHLLEPMGGDLIYQRHNNRINDDLDSYSVWEKNFNTKFEGWTFTIIQRQGKPFPKIEWEDVE